MRATQKKIISYPVTSTLVGKNRLRSGVSSGQPSVEKGQRAELNHVSSTSGSWRICVLRQCGHVVRSVRLTLISPQSSQYHAGI